MTVIAHTQFHPRGCITICQSDTPCLCIRAFRISRRVGFDKIYLRLCYHKAPAADTLIASGLLGIERRGSPLFLIILKGSQGHNLYPSLAERFFRSYAEFESYRKRLSCMSLFSFFWVLLSGFELFSIWDRCWEGLYEFLFEIKALVLRECGF